MARKRTCPACGGPMEENVIEDRLTDHNTGERRLVGELATFVCEWCDYRVLD